MRLRVAPLTLAALLSLAGINVWLLAIVVQSPTPEPEVATSAVVPAPPASQIALPKPKPITAYAQTLASPLFFKSRAPYVPPPATPPPAPEPVAPPPPEPVDPGLALGGVVITEETRKAYVFNKNDSQGAWLGEGEDILGWKVDAIDAMTVRLQQADRSLDLELYPMTK
jgi:hypothetical protein